MSYPKRLLRLRPTRGIIRDLPAHEVPDQFYTDGNNVLFRAGFPRRILGSRDAYSTALGVASPTQLMHALNAEVSDVNYWLLFEDDGTAWAVEGNNATQIDATLLSAQTLPFLHTSALLNGLPIYSNGSDEPVYWAGANLITLPGWTATETCQFITVFKFHIFALNISGPGGSFPNLIKWSDAAPPGTVPGSGGWTPSSTNEAGDTELSDSPGALVCAYPLRDSLAIYKRSSMYLAQYVGGNQVFSFRKARSAVGALAPRSVCDIDGQHLVVSDGDIVLTDGTNKRSIGESRMKDYLFNQIDQTNYRNIFCSYNRGRDEAVIGFPTSGNEFCNKALVYDVNTDSFGIRDLQQVVAAPVGFVNDETESNNWADRSDVWADAADVWGSSTIAAARDSIVHVRASSLRQQDTIDEVSEAASLVRGGITFGEPERIKFVKRVHILKDANSGPVLVRVGGRMTLDGAETLSPEVQLNDGEQIMNCTIMGRYISVQIRTAGTNVWRVTGIEIEAELRGYH